MFSQGSVLSLQAGYQRLAGSGSCKITDLLVEFCLPGLVKMKNFVQRVEVRLVVQLSGGLAQSSLQNISSLRALTLLAKRSE